MPAAATTQAIGSADPGGIGGLSFLSTQSIMFSASGSSRWMSQVQSQDANATVSPHEHNSAIIALGVLMDGLANPQLVANAMIGGVPMVSVDRTIALAGATSSKIPIVGLLDPPAEPARRMYWDALAQLLSMIAGDFHQVADSTFDGSWPADSTPIFGARKIGHAVTEPWLIRPGFVYQESPDVRARYPAIYTAATSLLQRLSWAALTVAQQQAVQHSVLAPVVPADASQPTAAENAAWPDVQTVATYYRQQQTKRRWIYGGALAAFGAAAVGSRLLSRR